MNLKKGVEEKKDASFFEFALRPAKDLLLTIIFFFSMHVCMRLTERARL